MSTEEINSALELYASSYSAISHSDILETIQMWRKLAASNLLIKRLDSH